MSISGDNQAQRIAAINRLMTAQSMMYASPNELRLGEFVCQALKEFTDIDECCLCLRGFDHLIGDSNQVAQELLDEMNSFSSDKPHFKVSLPENEHTIIFTLHTFERTYGYLMITFGLTAMSDSQKSLINNFINVFSSELERRYQKAILDKQQEHLEALVSERTADLNAEITERKEAMADLKNSEERYRALFDSGPNPMVIHDGERILDVNPATLLALGLKDKTEIIGKDPLSFVHKEDREESNRRVEALLAHHSSLAPIEFKIVTHNRGERIVKAYPASIIYEDQPAIMVSYLDITEIKKVEQQLIESKEHTERYLNIAAEIIMLLDINGNIALLNESGHKLLGYQQDELLGRNWFDTCLQPEDRADVKQVFNMTMTGEMENVKQYENPVVTKTGVEKHIRWHNSILKDDQGKITGVISSGEDITTQLNAEAALRESEAQLRILYDQSPDMYLSVSSANAQIIRCNERFLVITGYTEDEVVGKPVFMMYHDDCMDDVRQTFAEFVEKGIINDRELIIKRKDGSKLDVSLNVNSVKDDDGNIQYSLSSWRDITERKEAEARQLELETKLRQSQKLEAIGRMAGGIAHDFNNILQAQSLYLELIQAQLPEDEHLRSNFQRIVATGDRSKELVKQILTFSRKEKIDLVPTKIHNLIKDALKLVRATTPTTIDIRDDICISCGPVLCDTNQMHQVIVNLCNNAVHAMRDKGGILSVSYQASTDNIDSDLAGKVLNDEGVVELIVSDTGSGIDDETLEQIYDPFFTTKEVGEGTGLGLSIVHGIIADMQGDIKVETEPGKGTAFKLRLPLHS